MSAAPAKKILLVVGEEHVTRLLSQLLREYEVIVCRDGGLAEAIAHRPDLVIADVQMSGAEGLALAHALRNDPAVSGLPVVFLAPPRARTRGAQIVSVGTKHLVHKPLDGYALSLLVGRALGQTARTEVPPRPALDRSREELKTAKMAAFRPPAERDAG